MENHSRKINKIKKDSDSVFSEIFGFGKKKNKPNMPVGAVQKIGNIYRMGKSVITSIQGASEMDFLSYDWESSPLSWLIDCEFEGSLWLDLKKGILVSFGGIWKDGVFLGKSFSAVKNASFGVPGSENNNVEFGKPGVSSPIYYPSYDSWHAPFINFKSGTIHDGYGGILGMEDAKIGPVTNSFNLLTLLPGYELVFKMNSSTPVRGDKGRMERAPVNTIHRIKMLKRIDSKSSDIELKIENGETNKEYFKDYPWTEFVEDGGNALIYGRGGGLSDWMKGFGIDLSSGGVTAEVRVSGKSNLKDLPYNKVGVEKKLATSQQSFDLKKIPYLNIDKPYNGSDGKFKPGLKGSEAYFYMPRTEYLNKFNEVKRNIESGVMAADMDMIASGIRNGVITGFHNNLYLKSIFNNIKGDEQTPDDYASALGRLDDFMRYFVDRIYKQGDNGSINKPVQDIIKGKIKSSLRVDSYIKNSNQAPGTKKPQRAKGKTIKPISLSESIVYSMKKIISRKL